MANCICKEIQEKDATRHFRECPERPVEIQVSQANPSVSIKEPDTGWKKGFQFLLGGVCPYCLFSLKGITCHPVYGVTWSCPNGCNP